MERRRFLSLLGKGLMVSSLAGVFPAAVFGQTALDYALEGQNYLQNGAYNKALEALLKAVELDPQSDWAYGLLGRRIGDSIRMQRPSTHSGKRSG